MLLENKFWLVDGFASHSTAIALHGIDVINISLREFRDTKAAHALSIEILPFKVLEIFFTSPLESRSKSSHVCNYEGH